MAGRPVDVDKEAVVGPITHNHVVVDTTGVQLSTVKIIVRKGVLLRADSANTVDIYIGNRFVTANNTVGTGGLPIAPGEALFIPIDDPSLLYVRVSAGTEDLAWLAI